MVLASSPTFINTLQHCCHMALVFKIVTKGSIVETEVFTSILFLLFTSKVFSVTSGKYHWYFTHMYFETYMHFFPFRTLLCKDLAVRNESCHMVSLDDATD